MELRDKQRRGALAPLVKFREATRHLSPDEFVEIDGQRIHVRVSGAGPSLVLLHGFMASFFSFREIVPELAKSFRVISIDLNGFGLTERPAAHGDYRIESQADLIIRVLEKLGAPPGTILGHSYGAAVASVAALRHPDAVTKLILVSPASSFDKLPWYARTRPGQEILYLLCRRLLSDPRKYRAIASRAFYTEGVLTDEVSETYRRHLLIEGLRSTFFGFMEVLGGQGFARISFEEIRQPVLVIAGDKDAVIPLESCRLIAGQLQKCQLEVLVDCGHSAPEECPAVVIDLMTRFANET